MPAPISLVPPRPGDGSGICEREETPRDRYERERYEPGRCPECGENRCPPEMDFCPVCHPEADYDE